MESITLKPEDIRERFKTHFATSYTQEHKKQNDAILAKAIGRNSCQTLPFIDHEILNNLLLNYTYSSLNIVEELGEKNRLNEWSHQFKTLEEAKESVYERTRNSIIMAKEDLIRNKKLFAFFKFLYKAHLLNDAGRNNVGGLIKLMETLDSFDIHSVNIDVVFMTQRKIPSHLPVLGDEFWVAGLHMQPLPSITHCNVSRISVYDWGKTTEEDGMLTVSISLSPVNEQDKHGFEIDDDRFKKSDGQIFDVGMNSYRAYKNEQDAIKAVKEYAQKKYNELKNFI